MKKLLLIDGNAILHRAYHAYPPLTNAKGEVVNAVYGFFMMFLSMLQDQKPEYVVICFDRPKPTIRQAMYVNYHAHRPKADDAFVSQIGLVHELLERMHVAVFEKDGYEGDDLIGTIARQAVEKIRGPVSRHPSPTSSRASLTAGAREGDPTTATPLFNNGLEVIIVTGDRDLLQLVNPQVKVLMPLVGLTKTVLFDEHAVEEKYGVKPSQFVDYKALIGDASDGYPGVSGIGPKTAAKLIREYGSFEALYAHIGELPEKIGIKLATDAEQAALAKKLAAIITDVSIEFDLEQCRYDDFTVMDAREGFVEHGFRSLIARLDQLFQIEELVKPEREEKKSEQLGLLDE